MRNVRPTGGGKRKNAAMRHVRSEMGGVKIRNACSRRRTRRDKMQQCQNYAFPVLLIY